MAPAVKKFSDELAGLVRAAGGIKAAVESEYAALVQKSSPRLSLSFRACLQDQELGKTTFPEILTFDHNRFKLSASVSTFINASSVKGWNGQRDAYLLTQIPREENWGDFWQMVWQSCASTVAVLLPLRSFRLWPPPGVPGPQYRPWWPTEMGAVLVVEKRFKLSCEEVVCGLDWTLYSLRLELPLPVRSARLAVQLLQYEAWAADSSPPPALPRFLARLRLHADAGNLKNHVLSAPTLFVCPTGVQRCGLVAALDICAQRLLRTRMVDVAGALDQLRRQRYGALSKAWEFLWLHQRLLDLAISTDILSDKERESLGGTVMKLHNDLQVDPVHDASVQGPSVTTFY